MPTHQNGIKTQAQESTRVHQAQESTRVHEDAIQTQEDAIQTQASRAHQDPGAREHNAQRARMRAGRQQRRGQRRGRERVKRQEAGKSRGARVCERGEQCVCARICTPAHTDARTDRERGAEERSRGDKRRGDKQEKRPEKCNTSSGKFVFKQDWKPGRVQLAHSQPQARQHRRPQHAPRAPPNHTTVRALPCHTPVPSAVLQASVS
jgi:hypothetical protein